MMFPRTLLAVAVITALSTPVLAQAGHNATVAPPPGLHTIVCSGRAIPQFQDITEKSGITFQHFSDPNKRYIPESMGGGVILLDYDRDGWPDIYFTNAPSVAMAIAGKHVEGALYHNNHDGTFTDVTAKAGLTHACFGMGGAIGDINDDGWPDLFLTCLGGNILYRNNGDGTFTDITAKAGVRDGRWSTGAAFGDYDGDGFVDLMVSNYVDFSLKDLPAFGSAPNCRYLGMDVQCGPRGLKGSGDDLYHNNGDGTFTDVAKAAGVDDPNGYYGLGVLWSDFDSSGKPDIFVANDSTPNFLYKNDGNGTFTEMGMVAGVALSNDGFEQASMGVAAGDYNHTGRPSLFVTNFSGEDNDLYRNDGGMNFTDVSYPSGIAAPSLAWVKWGNAFADLDNDGWLDAVSVSGHVYPQVDGVSNAPPYKEPALLEMNQTNGTFCDASRQAGSALSTPHAARGLAVGDLFNNGNLDLVIENLDGAPVVLQNEGIVGRHWVSFELAGTKSNRMALNARVTLSAGGMTQTAEVHSGGSYLSQNDVRLHFGLGAATRIDGVSIHWPSGRVEALGPLDADHFYSVLEGHGVVPFQQIRPSAPAH
jgi:hypothetical protein